MKITDLSRNQNNIQEFEILSKSEAMKIGGGRIGSSGGRNGSGVPSLRMPKEDSQSSKADLIQLHYVKLHFIKYINSQK